MPVRKIKASQGYAYRGKEPSTKSATGMVYWESLLELAAVRLFNFDPAVEEIEHQPLTFKFHYSNKVHHYTPDYKLGMTNGDIILLEVKPNKFISDPLVRVKLEVGRRYCQQMGWGFRVLSEDKIYKGNLQWNLDLLLDVRDFSLDTSVAQPILQTLKSVGECLPAALFKHIKNVSREEFEVNLYLLIYERRIYADLINDLLDPESSLIRIPKKGDWNAYGWL